MVAIERTLEANFAANRKTAGVTRAMVRRVPSAGAVIVTDGQPRKGYINSMLAERDPDIADRCRILIVRSAEMAKVLLRPGTLPALIDRSADFDADTRVEVNQRVYEMNRALRG